MLRVPLEDKKHLVIFKSRTQNFTYYATMWKYVEKKINKRKYTNILIVIMFDL